MIIYDGPSAINGEPIIGIVTFRTRNRKTGRMSQLWILPKEINPLRAALSGCDQSVCGDCPMRRSIGGACYVNIGQAPTNIWKAFQRGKYSKAPQKKMAQHIRLGSYGDPTALPYEVVSCLMQSSGKQTAYTHMWRTCDQRFKDVCMASCDSLQDHAEAKAMGWRTFRVVADYSERLPSERVCLADSKGKHCADCMLCGGGKGPDIVIKIHGNRRKKWVEARKRAS